MPERAPSSPRKTASAMPGPGHKAVSPSSEILLIEDADTAPGHNMIFLPW